MTVNLTRHEYLKPKEVAVILRCSVRTLARMRAEGTGPRYHKRRGRILYPRVLVHEWVSQSIATPVRYAA